MLAELSEYDRTLPQDNTVWPGIPIAFLQAQLSRRNNGFQKPDCGSGRRGAYNTPLHVFALVLILVLSTAACSFPIIVRRVPRLPIPHYFLFLSRHFGTGVLIATAFVHLLPTAFNSLTDPCLPSFWNEGYPAMAGLIAMTSMLIVVGIEMFFATRGAGHMHASEYDTVPEGQGEEHMRTSNGHAKPQYRRQGSFRAFQQASLDEESSQSIELRTTGPELDLSEPRQGIGERRMNHANEPIYDAEHHSNHNESDLALDELDPDSDTNHLVNGNRRVSSVGYEGSGHVPDLNTYQQQQKLLLQCLLLEAGILFHSVFIGMALSVSTGPAFVVLLIAISFHQTFEGLALGSRIAAITSFPPSSPKPWLMALAYGTTTPIGQTIGLGVHNLYDPAGQFGLLTVGVMNAISSGLLLFAGLVELLAEDFLSDRSYEVLKDRRRLEACGAVVAGAFLMALVGAWA